jgi:hypothetical protein
VSSRLLSKKVKIKLCKIILFYGCETCSLTLREVHRLRIFENRVVKRIFGPKSDEMVKGWRKLHNEELHNLYPSPETITVTELRRMTGIRNEAHV